MTSVLLTGNYARSVIPFRGPLVRALVGRGHTVTVSAPSESEEIDGEVARGIADLGAMYRPYSMVYSSVNPLRELGSVLSLGRLIAAVRPEAFIGYTIKPVIYGSFSSRALRIPRIYALVTGLGYTFVTSTAGSRLISKATTLALRKAYQCCARVVFWNDDDRDLCVTRGLVDRGRTEIVNGSGVDTSHFAPAALPLAPPRFLLIARLLGDKGVREFAEAARSVKARHPEAEFRIVGPAHSHPNAISRAELDRWTGDGTLTYGGEVDDVRPEISRSSVIVLPSYREGIPRVLLEGMAMGRPAVATDVPGCRSVVTDGETGLLVPARDAAALARALGTLVENPAKISEMGARARRDIERRFDADSVAKDLATKIGL